MWNKEHSNSKFSVLINERYFTVLSYVKLYDASSEINYRFSNDKERLFDGLFDG